MRDQLRQIEGQLVYLTGKPSAIKDNGKFRDVCVKRPKVIPWDTNAPLDFKAPAVACDHLWLRSRPDRPLPMYLDCIAVGRIGYYTRTDGSLDLGIQNISPIFNVDEQLCTLLEATRRLKSQSQALVRANQLLRDIQTMLKAHSREWNGVDVYCYSEIFSVAELKRKVSNIATRMDSLTAHSVLNGIPKASKPSEGSALFLSNKPAENSLPVSSVDRLLKGLNV